MSGGCSSGVLGATGRPSFSLLFESPGLSHVAVDILCMLDLSTFVSMERVSRAVASLMASHRVWRRRLLLVEARRDACVRHLLEKKTPRRR